MDERGLLRREIATAFFGGFHELRPCQKAALPILTGGKNLVLCSGTGSGKTEAALAPLLSHHFNHTTRQKDPTILYISPTKALANDLERRLVLPLGRLNLNVGIRHGDRDDLRTKKQVHILVTTPESLDVLLFRGEKALGGIKAVVLDEVHLLYNSQRGLHLSILLERLRKKIEGKFQWAALSATVSNPSDVRDFLFGKGEEAEFYEQTLSREIDGQIRFVKNGDDVRQLFNHLFDCERGKYLLFANSRWQCEWVANCLAEEAKLSNIVFTHYSSISAPVRVQVEDEFNKAKKALCIATSTLELGIDIGDVDLVVLFGPPPNIESFLQRIGRGSRRIKKTNLLCIVRPPVLERLVLKPRLEALHHYALLSLARECRMSDFSPFSLYGAACQQMLSLIGSGQGQFFKVSDLCSLVAHHEHLNRGEIEKILHGLEETEYLTKHTLKNQYGPGRNLHKLIDLRRIYGNFPASSKQIEVRYGGKTLGHVPQINLILPRGQTVRFLGKTWTIVRVEQECISLEPSGRNEKTVNFRYGGKGPQIDGFLCSIILDILQNRELSQQDFHKDVLKMLSPLMSSFRDKCPKGTFPYSKNPDGYVYLTFAGLMANKAAALINRSSPDGAQDLALHTSEPVEWERIPPDPEEYESVIFSAVENTQEETIFQSLLPDKLRMEELSDVWRKDRRLKSTLERLKHSTPVCVPQRQLNGWGII